MQKKNSATIYDVAHRVGVSLATVSRVVNGNSNVRDSTKRKVLDAIEELGYHPNAVARGLAYEKNNNNWRCHARHNRCLLFGISAWH